MSKFWQFLGIMGIVVGVVLFFHAAQKDSSVFRSLITFVIIWTGMQLMLGTPNGKALSEKDLVVGRYYRVVGRCWINKVEYALLKRCYAPVSDERIYKIELSAVPPDVKVFHCQKQNKKKILVPESQ